MTDPLAFNLFSLLLAAAAWLFTAASALLIPLPADIAWIPFLTLSLLAVLALRLEFKVGRGRVGLEPAALVPLAFVAQHPVPVALAAFGAAAASSLSLAGRRRHPWKLFASASAFIIPYALPALVLRHWRDPARPILDQTVLIFGVLAFAFLCYLSLYAVGERLRRLPYDRSFWFTTMALGGTFLSLAPIAVLELLLLEQFGTLALLAAFLPVGVVSLVLMRVAEREEKQREAARRQAELKVLRDVYLLTAEARPEPAFFQRILAGLGDLVRYEAGALVFWEQLSDSGDPEVVTALAGPLELTGDQFKSGTFRHQLPAAVPPPSNLAEFSRQVRLGKALRHSVLFPLKTPELQLGLVYLAGDDPELEDPRLRELVQVVCDALALTLQNSLLRDQMARINAQLSEQARTLEDILEIGTEITFKQEVDAILQRIASAIRDALGFRVVAVALREPEAGAFRRRAHAGGDPRGETLQAGPIPEALVYRLWTEDHRVSKSFMVRRLLQDAAQSSPDSRRDSGTWHHSSILHVPLKAEGQVMGYIAAEDPADRRTPSYDRVRVLEIFASQAVAAVQAYRAYEQVRQLSIQDPMTGAFNFRHLQDVIARELRRHVRTGHPFHLAILDLDNFKEVNDRFGHPAGDQVLQGLVALIRAQVRAEVDLVFRYGGDELAVVFPEIAAEPARAVLERVRAAVEAHAFRFECDGGYREHHLTVSVGFAGFPTQATERAGLIGAADQALLQAKARGKNRVVGAGEENDTPAI